MERIFKSSNYFSQASSEMLRNVFKGKLSSEELLKDNYIIKGMKIGLSFLSKDNKRNIMNDMLGNELTHSSIYLKLESLEESTGVIVQYGQYEYFKGLYEVNGKIINNCGFPYGKEGGLMFGEMSNDLFNSHYCTVGILSLILSKKHYKMTLKTFLEKVKKIKGPWNLKSYDPLEKSCHDFVVAALQVLKPSYNEQLLNIKCGNNIPIVIKNELNKRIIEI